MIRVWIHRLRSLGNTQLTKLGAVQFIIQKTRWFKHIHVQHQHFVDSVVLSPHSREVLHLKGFFIITQSL